VIEKFEERILERTFLMIKPDGVQRNLVGEIIRRFEAKGFTLVGLKLMNVSQELAQQHYGVHKERPFFPGLVKFITSGPVVAMVWEGEGVIASARKIIGATNPLNAEPGTIRGDYGVTVGRNLIHGSDALETAQHEISLWFKEEELASWQPSLTSWLYE
jgi:nucleoside-diphosphate kinase